MRFLQQVAKKERSKRSLFFMPREEFERVFDACFEKISKTELPMRNFVRLDEIYECVRDDFGLRFDKEDFLYKTMSVLEGSPKYRDVHGLTHDKDGNPILWVTGVKKELPER